MDDKQEILREFADRLLPEKIRSRLESAAKTLPGGRVLRAGKTSQGRDVWMLTAGNLDRAVLYAGGVHAQEGITSEVLLLFAEYLQQGMEGENIFLVRRESFWNRAGLILLPCLNPDGILMARPGWQANARGVDLNHNFDAGWEACKKWEEGAGILSPGPTKYGGRKPFSEPESCLIKRLCNRRKFLRMIAFHSQGEEIYAGHGEKCDDTTATLGQLMEKLTGYRLCQPSESASHGGMKDWFYDTFHRPAYTLEIGKGCNPLPLQQAEEIFLQLRKLLLLFPLL